MDAMNRPVFIIGAGRSGTTWLSRMLATHPDLAYFSSWTNRFPGQPWVAFLSRMNDVPALEARMRYTKKWPRITEAYQIWDRVIPGFSDPPRDLVADDATDDIKARTRAIVRAHMRWQGKPRFLAKYVGFVRIDLIREIFPDAQFICLDRDPRPMLHSQMLKRWGYEDRPDAWEQTPVEDLLRFYVHEHKKYLAYKERFTAGVDYHQFYYEHLLADPVTTVRAMCAAVDLCTPQAFLDKVADWRVDSQTNVKWEQALTGEQISLFNRLLADPLHHYSTAVE